MFTSMEKDVEKVENEKNDAGMYIINKEYTILNFNKSTSMMYPELKIGDICYEVLAMRKAPCENCPLRENPIFFFNEPRKEWISASSAEMDYPGHGECYNIQFRRQSRAGGIKREQMHLEEIDKYVAEMKDPLGQECAIGAYCEPGAPIFFANEHILKLLSYDSTDEFIERIGGQVMNSIHPDDHEQVKRDSKKASKLGDVYETSFRMLKKDGTWLWMIAKGKIVETMTKRWATITVCTDMSSYIRNHENLRMENQELLHKEMQSESIFLRIPGGYHRCGLEEGYPFLYVSESFQKVVGWTKEEIEAEFDNKFLNLVWSEDVHLFDNMVEQIDKQGQGNAIYRIKQKGGKYRWVQDSTMFVDIGEKRFYQCTLADISAYIEELEEARERAEVSNRAKSTFLFNASHDIRTPMNAIHGFTAMLKQRPNDEAFVREMVNKIEASSDTLMKLLNEVLELSRIESGKEEVNLTTVELSTFAEHMNTMFKQEILSAGITFEMENSIQDDCVMCDELKMTQIWMNMLSNARKFTPKGGKITFGITQLPCQKRDYGKYRFYVRDTGIGMSEEFQKRAFEQFERERTATDSGMIGSGLGMSIIRKLVELMGGTCTLKSEQGKGTEIAAVLKLAVSTEAVQPREEIIGSINDLNGKRILLVEDNAFNREIARFVLESAGAEVEEAENGSEAVCRLINAEAGYYNLVLMDIQMPIMDGYVATYEIRRFADEAVSNIPIIAMTANAFHEDKKKCLDAGMNGHISKPIDKTMLMKEIAKVLK